MPFRPGPMARPRRNVVRHWRRPGDRQAWLLQQGPQVSWSGGPPPHQPCCHNLRGPIRGQAAAATEKTPLLVAVAWQCGLHRSDRMFHRTHAGAYVHFSRILPNDEKTSKKGPFFGQKLSLFGLRQAVEYHFLSKIGQKRQFFGQKLNLFAFSKAVEDPPPYFEGAGCERSGCRHTQIRKTQFTASICTKSSNFS